MHHQALVALAAIGIALVLTACGSTSGSRSASTSKSAACGTLPNVPPNDSAGTLATATAAAKAQYNGWPYQLRPSALANWKPRGKPPYTVGVLFDGVANSFQASAYAALQQQLRRDPLVGKVIAVATPIGEATQQVQAYESMVEKAPALIVLEPDSAPAFVAPIHAALARGVATLSIINAVDDASAVSFVPNVYTSAGAALARFLKLRGGHGSLLGVQGTAGTAVEETTRKAFQRVLALCPNIHLAGTVNGNFTPSTARAVVLQFLATHPGKIDGVFDSAVMGPAIIGAFEQAGRPVPPVTAMVAQNGELAYWATHISKGYTSAGFAAGPVAFATNTAEIARRILAGQGPRPDMIPWPQPQITSSDLGQYVRPGSTLNTPGTAEPPPSTNWSGQDLGSLFHHPNATGGS